MILHKKRMPQISVFAVGSHDTARVIAAIPFDGEEWAFLGSGTWSLAGDTNGQPDSDAGGYG